MRDVAPNECEELLKIFKDKYDVRFLELFANSKIEEDKAERINRKI